MNAKDERQFLEAAREGNVRVFERLFVGDLGMLYAFAWPECRITASFVQSH